MSPLVASRHFVKSVEQVSGLPSVFYVEHMAKVETYPWRGYRSCQSFAEPAERTRPGEEPEPGRRPGRHRRQTACC